VVTVLRQPQGKFGCRISGSNTMSEVHARGAAKAAGLFEGWLVKAINGKRVTLRERVRQTACLHGMLAEVSW